MGKKSSFRVSMTLKEVVWTTVNRGKLTPDDLEDAIGYSASSLKRAGLDGESGSGFNLYHLIALMNAQDDYGILEHLNNRCGYIAIPIPKGGKSRKERIGSVAEYQKLTASAVEVLVRLIDDGASEQEAADTLYRMLKGTAEMIEDVKSGKQIELDFGSQR